MFSRKSPKSQKLQKIQTSRNKSMFSRLTSRFQTRKNRSPTPSIRESSIQNSTIQLEPAIKKEEIQKQIEIINNMIATMKEVHSQMLIINRPEITNAQRIYDDARTRLVSTNNNGNRKQIAINKERYEEAHKHHKNLLKEIQQTNDTIDLLVKLKSELEEKIKNIVSSHNKSGGTRKRRKY